MKRHRKGLEVISQINITNLLDTAFILLIAFMIVVPTLKSGIPVDLPKMASPESIQDDKGSYLITIAPKDLESAGDRIFLNRERIELDDLALRVTREFEANPDLVVTIEGDREAMWGTGVEIISICREAGVERFDLLGEPDIKDFEGL